MKIRNKSVVVLLGIAVAGIVGASAASLGLTTQSLGADATIVAACDSAISASYTSAYNATSQDYQVSGVKLSNVSTLCSGQTYAVTLDGATIPGVEATGTVLLTNVVAGSGEFTVSFTGIAAKDVNNLAVVISG